MTPVAGLLMSVIAGWVVQGPRRAIVAVAPPWFAVLSVQTWTLGTGQGTNPASTISDMAYWVVQLATLGLALGVAATLSDWRARRAARARLVTEDHIAPTQARWRASLGTAVATAAAGALSLAYVVFNPVAPAARQTGSGQPPLYGLAALVACIVILIVFGVAAARARTLDTHARLGAEAATSSRST